MTWSPDFGAPPSTSTSPSPVEHASTLLPPPSTTDILSVRRRTPPDACCALRTREEVHMVNIPRAPFKTSLRFTSSLLLNASIYFTQSAPKIANQQHPIADLEHRFATSIAIIAEGC